MEYEIAKISDDLIHIHDASNYAREALGNNGGCIGAGLYANERVVTTLASEGQFRITVRIKGSLAGYTAGIALLSVSGSDRVDPGHLKAAVEALKEKIRL